MLYASSLRHRQSACSMPCVDALSTRICIALIHNMLQNGPFRAVKRPISQCKTAHIATRFGPFRKPVWYGMFGHHGRTGPWWGPAAYAKIYHKGYNYWQNVGCDAHTREKVLTFLNISYHIATWRYTARCAYVLSKICCKTCILETDC